MLSYMAKTKPTKPETQPTTGRAPVLNLRLGHEREAAIAEFIAAQKVPPDKTAVVLAAVDKFLEEEGLWQPKEPAKKQ